MNKKFLLMFIFAIFFLSFISSAPPFQSNTFSGYQIKYPAQDLLKVNQSFKIDLHVYNISTGLPINSGLTCYVHFYNSTGMHTITLAQNTPAHVYDYEFLIDGKNISISGHYSYVAQCNSSAFGGFVDVPLEVTPNGEEATTGKAVFYIGLLAVLLFFLGISIYFFSDTDNLLTKVGSLGIAYLLLIAVTFIAWAMASDFLTSSPFLIAMLNILFIVLVIGAFPLLIGMFAWYVIMVFQIKEINRLMEKGLSFDEAKRRQGSKYK